MGQNKNSETTKYIDIIAILKNSNSQFLKRLPTVFLTIIAMIIRQKSMNRIINKCKNASGFNFHKQVIDEFQLKININGLENLPENSKNIFVSNHPFGIVDGMILTSIVGEKYGDLRAIGNDAFLLVPNLRPYIAAINVFGRCSRQAALDLDKIYQSDVAITHFPAGEVSRVYNGKVQDAPWQKSFINKAVVSQRDIVPFYFEGKNSWLFYAIYRVRKLLRITVDVELILLPRELFSKKGKTIHVYIGKPISWKTFDNSLTSHEWAQKVRQQIYSLAKPT